LDSGENVICVLDITGKRQTLGVLLPELLRDLLYRMLVDIDTGNGAALSGKGMGARFTQAAARAGDENRFPWQITVLWHPHFLSPLKKSTLFKNVLSLDERAPVSRWPIGHR
jgi:hypothetical protein